ncbi:MAG: hypothetical protein JXQ75_06180 [Phycisphaerae bacterium]|nr:hypothetical protein [Phycisphaerae bacterium]
MSAAIALDIDGTIDQAPELFSFLSKHWPGKVYVVTYREDRQDAEEVLASWGIRYDALYLVRASETKTELLERLGDVRFFFEDMDEAIESVPKSINCFKVRNAEDFDFDSGRWRRPCRHDDDCG